ncbi:MAG: UDP-glucose 4-epimerase GalE [Planctomycetes bacterium]|nr:UDP-glucose 4-epimerase GalE [Planctomycetota bacterium]
MRVLVTGGAGYIGSHTLRALRAAGHTAAVFDDLSSGHLRAIGDVPLHRGSITDAAALASAFAAFRPEAVIHFAGLTSVAESVEDPNRYFDVNIGGADRLLEAMERAGTARIVFSSSAAVYGAPAVVPIPEDAPLVPINPYGVTKKSVELRLALRARDRGLAAISLRYFNAAGADPDGTLGEDHTPERHLIPNVLAVALDRAPAVEVFGDDYPTPDGSCLRDFVHVGDLAQAHVLALERLRPGEATAYNLGSATGTSVLEVIAAGRRITGHPIPIAAKPRRPGDPPSLVASRARAEAELGWIPKFDSIERIIETAWNWHRGTRGGIPEAGAGFSR